MNIATVKLEIVKLVMDTQSEAVLATVKDLLETQDQGDFLDTLSDEEKKELGLDGTQKSVDEIPDFNSVISKLRL